MDGSEEVDGASEVACGEAPEMRLHNLSPIARGAPAIQAHCNRTAAAAHPAPKNQSGLGGKNRDRDRDGACRLQLGLGSRLHFTRDVLKLACRAPQEGCRSLTHCVGGNTRA